MSLSIRLSLAGRTILCGLILALGLHVYSSPAAAQTTATDPATEEKVQRFWNWLKTRKFVHGC